MIAAFQYYDRDRDSKITARDLSAILDMDLHQFSISDIGKSYAEIIHKEAEEDRKLYLELKRVQDSKDAERKKRKTTIKEKRPSPDEVKEEFQDAENPLYENWFKTNQMDEEVK